MANSEDQMSNLFEEGGIADDGMNVDPVSGNEIPPGSMAQEVRDDVPAQLSEGEYVVPADVLRFYGVKFFEDLRAEAKQGMMQMEADGRIGGEPVPAGGPEQEGGNALSPEEMAVLQEMGMAVGGMVPQPTQSTDPYMQQQQMYQQPSPVAMGNTGYAEGGSVRGYNEAGVVANPETLSAFDPTQYGRGSMIDNVRNAGTAEPTQVTAEPTQVTVVMLYSPDGLMTESFTLPAQQAQYDARIAEGWAKEQVAVTTETSVSVNDEDPNDYGNDTGEGGKKFSEMSPEELQKAYESNKKAKSIMSGMSLAFPGLGLLGMGATNHAENQIKKAMEALSYTPFEDKDGEGILSVIGDSIKSIFGGDKKEEPKKTPVITPTLKQEGATDEPTYTGGTSRPVTQPSGEVSSNNEAAETTRNTQAASVRASEAKASGTAPTGRSTMGSDGAKTETYASKVQRGGGYSKGGVVDKKATKKGLGSK